MQTALAMPAPEAAPDGLFEDEELLSIQSRALAYLAAGVPVHLRGPAGMGKTTLASRIAERRGRPVGLVTGDRWLTREGLVGREIGQTARRVDDTYVNRVRRTETQVRADWHDSVLSVAMREGHTLIYDEFTRATPEANAVLLSVLEERMLVFHDPAAGRTRLDAHPEFRMVLTSNPHDYVGVEHAPDALIDRMVTFDLDHVAPETEAGVVAARTGLPGPEAMRVVRLVRALREGVEGPAPSMRTSVLIARLAAAQGAGIAASDPLFVQICLDVLRSRHGAQGFEGALARAFEALEPAPLEVLA